MREMQKQEKGSRSIVINNDEVWFNRNTIYPNL